MHISWFIWMLLGVACGGILGLICGLWLADEHWKNKICPYCDREYEHYKRTKQ